MIELDPEHLRALKGLRDTLAAHKLVTPYVPEQVFVEGDVGASEWARCLVILPGRSHGNPKGPGGRKLLAQRDAIVEVRAESPAVLDALCEAVSKAVNGELGTMEVNGYKQVVHSNTGAQREWEGGVCRSLLFGLFLEVEGSPARAAHAADVTVVIPPPKLVNKE